MNVVTLKNFLKLFFVIMNVILILNILFGKWINATSINHKTEELSRLEFVFCRTESPKNTISFFYILCKTDASFDIVAKTRICYVFHSTFTWMSDIYEKNKIYVCFGKSKHFQFCGMKKYNRKNLTRLSGKSHKIGLFWIDFVESSVFYNIDTRTFSLLSLRMIYCVSNGTLSNIPNILNRITSVGFYWTLTI